MKKILFFLSLTSVLVFGCKKEEQVTIVNNPQLTISTPEETLVTKNGESLEVPTQIRHNEELSTVEVRSPWSENIEVIDATGNKDLDLELVVDVPHNATPGVYHIVIVVVDVQGNTSEQNVEVIVENGGSVEDPEDEADAI